MNAFLLFLSWLIALEGEAKQPPDSPTNHRLDRRDETNPSKQSDYDRINAKFPGWCEGMSHSEAMLWEDVWDQG